MSSGIVTGSREEGMNMPGVLWPYSADTALNTKLDGNGLHQCSPSLEVSFPWRHSRLLVELEVVRILPLGN